MARSTIVGLATTLTIILVADAAMDAQYCTRSEVMPSQQMISSQYAPSLITCSFICKENPDCKTFSFSENVCKLFRSEEDNLVTNIGPPKNTVTCTDDKKKLCPQTNDGNKFSCKPDPDDISCVCLSPRPDYLDKEKCSRHGLKLIAVESKAKDEFLVDLIKNYTNSCRKCFWTSGYREGSEKSPMKWNSTGNYVNLNIVNSSIIEGSGPFLAYRWFHSKWMWDDTKDDIVCCFLCEFQL